MLSCGLSGFPSMGPAATKERPIARTLATGVRRGGRFKTDFQIPLISEPAERGGLGGGSELPL